MSKATKPRPPKPQPAPDAKPAATAAARPKETWRDSIESILVAFILALVIRGFDAEAFVIPTGSMAPTLMGRHKEITCPQCGSVYSLNATDEKGFFFDRRGEPEPIRITYGTCPNCRNRAKVDESPSFNGDRILVMKFPYDLPFLPGAAKPKRWDVVVFHYPEQPEQNYIKRLVGLPGEELMILSGDIWTRPLGTDDRFVIQRKPDYKLDRILIPVYDDRNRPAAFSELPDWRRWQPIGAGWKPEPDGGAHLSRFEATAPDSGTAWLGYQHLIPDREQWDAAVGGLTPTPPRPSLIDDFYSYNSSQDQRFANAAPTNEPHWVGDLHLAFDYAGGDAQRLVVELIEAGVPHRATIDLVTGEATLTRGDDDPKPTVIDTPIRAGGSHSIAFSNIDDALTLWVDGRAVGEPHAYARDPAQPLIPTEADLQPARIGISGGSAAVENPVLRRDIHYTLQPNESDYQFRTYQEIRSIFQHPERFEELAQLDEPGLYPIRPKHYMMLGDNSPRSRDGRAWGNLDTRGGDYLDDYGRRWTTGPWSEVERAPHEVPEELITGRAFFVYWPHGVPFWPNWEVNDDFRFPFYPYFQRMKPIH